ncbi:MAG: mechanosensitive ion channel family protein [Oscillatoria sp. PMC 1068.18]|nr:mechanosensitive ion channel family protein [Oscillatoria sp. PMC 1076.18]MEC4989101.1 mechanosensitive ion channel family protein [Oscillatoria sp. PMC 1068.18]
MNYEQIKAFFKPGLDYIENAGIPDFVTFLLFALFSILLGRYTPTIVSFFVQRFFPKIGKKVSRNFINPLKKEIKITGTLIFISLSFGWLKAYPGLSEFLRPALDLALTISLAWLISRLFRRLMRVYGIDLLRKLGKEVNELLLIIETIANVIIIFVAATAFLNSQDVDLFGLLAGLGIGGLAIAFAAQKTLEQLLGTIVLYLDRPFIPGDYIRANFNIYAPDVFGRIESIGLRSTKIRIAGQGTLLIVPNSIMANKKIENVTRGKKVMVLLYLDFLRVLNEREQALVEQEIQVSTDTLYGIDPGSTRITFTSTEKTLGSRARVSFFILGSSENSLQLRKRLLELANKKISQELSEHGIEFTMQEPTIYVDSPVTI